MHLNKDIRNQAIIFGIIILFFSSQFFNAPINSSQQWKENEENNSIKTSNPDDPILWSYEIGSSISSLAISSDGSYVVTGDYDDRIQLFHKSSSIPLWSYTINGDIKSVEISADGNYMVASGSDGIVYLFESSSSTPLWTYDASYEILSITISSNGEYIVAGSYNKLILFHRSSSTPLWIYSPDYYISTVDISSDGTYIVAGGDHKLHLFEKSSSTPIWIYAFTATWSSGPLRIAISFDGNYIAVNENGGYAWGGVWSNIHLFHKSSPVPLWISRIGRYSSATSIEISADGNYITVGSSDGSIFLFHILDSAPLWVYGTGYAVNAVAISLDGNYIVAGNRDGTVYFFHKSSSTPLWTFTTYDDVKSVAISSSGDYIAAGTGYNGYLYLFSTLSYQDPIPDTRITGSPSGTINYNDVTFRWIGVDDNTPLWDMQYSYYLEGYDTDWSIWTSSTLKSYYNLPDGSYMFKVRAKDKDGNTDPTPDQRTFSVFYQPQDNPPVCNIELQQDGSEIYEIDVGEFFDIYVGDSSDDIGIEKVRFSSDDEQDGIVTGEWTEWYDWDAINNIMQWKFTTTGQKEVWVEIKDEKDQIAVDYKRISAIEWTFAIITDIHIGRGWLDYGAPGYEDYYLDGTPKEDESGRPNEGGFNCLTDRLMDTVNWINNNFEAKNIKFLIILGDIADTAEMSEFYRAKKILDNLRIPYFPIIGNHDIFSKFSFLCPDDVIRETEGVRIGDYYFDLVFNDDFYNQQFAKLGTSGQLQNYDLLQNYGFQYGGINFVCLDYAQRDSNLMSIIAQRFDKTDEWIEDNFKNRPEKTQLIFSHYPFMLEGGVTTDITAYLGKTASENSKDILTFGGHIHCTHNDNFDLVNTVLFNIDVPVIVTKSLMEKDKDFIRLINVNGQTIDDLNYKEIIDEEDFNTCYIPDGPAPELEIIDWLWSLLPQNWAFIHSPAELRVYDSRGRITGCYNGQIINEIPNSLYFDNTIVILESTDDYYYEIEGIDTSTYSLEVISIHSIIEPDTVIFNAIDIPISSNELHQYNIDWDVLSQGEEGVTVDVDTNGDGTIDHSFTSDNELNTVEYVVGIIAWPNEGNALQDGVIIEIEAFDDTLVEWLKVSIREPGGENGVIIPGNEYEEIPLVYQGDNLWCIFELFDTTTLPDGYYILFIQASDIFGSTSTTTYSFSIRNWALLELLPATERNRAGRTMPVKFSLRVVEAVDPEMPFVWNEELEIIIYDKNNPDIILQYSTLGDTSVDYRISSEDELYITNFKTSKTPAVYRVEIWRKGMLIGSFEFETYNSKINEGNSVSSSFENFQIPIGLNLNFLLLGMAYLLIIFRKKLIHL